MNTILNVDYSLLLVNYKSLGIKWLDTVGYSDDDLVNIMKNFKSLFPELMVEDSNIIMLKTISFVIHKNSIELTKNEIYDFFVLSYEFIKNHLIKNNIDNASGPMTSYSSYDNVILDLCNDIVTNYEKFENTLKIQIPSLFVDIVSILFFKTDLDGKRISSFQAKSYYETKKATIANGKYIYPLKNLEFCNNDVLESSKSNDNRIHYINHTPKKEFHRLYPTKRKNFSQHDQSDSKIYDSITDEIVFRLSQITHRDPENVRKSLMSLPENDVKKLFDLCNNYNKILKYGQLINLRDLKSEIESELGRTLSEKQIRHSQISIKKVQFYVENILDGTFHPHLTHGINHVKHNFEYGYRLAGLFNNKASGKKIN